jgi:putative sigma-54 modulation protein
MRRVRASTIRGKRSRQGGIVRIEIKGRNVSVDDELRKRVEKKFGKVAKQVSELAEMEIELKEERNPSIRESQIAEATLHLKGVTLRAQERSEDMVHSINLAAEDLSRQVKRHREKRRKRREAHKASPRIA